ncbi:MAG: hypothetical protein PUE01_00305 [Clostridiaceae bacterium]|nr:hypothetical protein [Clostridiaceae bacterium]
MVLFCIAVMIFLVVCAFEILPFLIIILSYIFKGICKVVKAINNKNAQKASCKVKNTDMNN